MSPPLVHLRTVCGSGPGESAAKAEVVAFHPWLLPPVPDVIFISQTFERNLTQSITRLEI